jgi:uncharacterized membrane protein
MGLNCNYNNFNGEISKMLGEIKNFGIKKWLLSLISLLLITDLLVILNVPYLREIMVFVTFSTIPGILILHLLRINNIEFIKKILLTVGLSISFIMFTALLLNSFYPLLLKPISLVPVLVFFNAVLIILAVGAYMRNKDFILGDFLNFNINFNPKLKSMLLFPLIFPFLAIFGTYLMNNSQNNIILLAMLFLIPIYVVILVWFKDKISNFVYPLTLAMIGFAFLLMYGLTSSYVIGRDVQFEFHFFNLVLYNSHWSPIGDIPIFNAYNACISVTLLPAILQVLSNLNPDYVFKLYYAFIGISLPLVLYTILRRYFSRQNAFFGSLIFVFQPYFIYFLGIVRQEIAFLFFLLTILVYFDDHLGKNAKKLLFLIFMISVVISHYTTAYVSFGVIIPILLVPFIRSLVKDRKLNFTNFDLIAVLLIFVFIWYFFVAGSQANAASNTISLSSSSISAGHNSLISNKDAKVLAIFGIGLKNIPNAISAVVNDLILLIMGIGFLHVIWNFSMWKKKIHSSFILGMLISPLILILPLVLPNLSIIYDIQRLFLQLVVFLAPLFLIGIYFIVHKLKRPNLRPIIILVLLISLFSCSTYLTYHFAGLPQSPYYDTQGAIRDEHFIWPQEIDSSKWISNHTLSNTSIIADAYGYSRLLLGNNSYLTYNTQNSNPDYYLYLNYANVVEGTINFGTPENISSYPNLLTNRSEIYNNGASKVFYGPL